MQFRSFAAIGDSFTEGVGDPLPDGRVRGWADLVAMGLAADAASRGEDFGYANLAIRGRLLGPIVDEQLEPAIKLAPELLSLNGGGNDIMRPKVTIEWVAAELVKAAEKAVDAGIHVLLLSGGNPTKHIPMGKKFKERGDALAAEVLRQVPSSGVTFVDNWADAELTDLRYWSVDKLHLNPLGHRKVATNVLTAFGVPVPDWGAEPPAIKRPGNAAYWAKFVLPWIGRRLTGRSSGDGRSAKRPSLLPVELS
ncbi:MAG: SGNH/GDSL hydrolase family protein [Cryobacterium sp.]|nr:SGNH/GDSL hydrolase family protein [Cryobacterium sp.]